MPPDVCLYHGDLMKQLDRIEEKVDGLKGDISTVKQELAIHVERHKERELADERVGRMMKTYEDRAVKEEQERRLERFNWRGVVADVVKWLVILGLSFFLMVLAQHSDLFLKALGS